jgi:hypothetical protein
MPPEGLVVGALVIPVDGAGVPSTVVPVGLAVSEAEVGEAVPVPEGAGVLDVGFPTGETLGEALGGAVCPLVVGVSPVCKVGPRVDPGEGTGVASGPPPTEGLDVGAPVVPLEGTGVP